MDKSRPQIRSVCYWLDDNVQDIVNSKNGQDIVYSRVGDDEVQDVVTCIFNHEADICILRPGSCPGRVLAFVL